MVMFNKKGKLRDAIIADNETRVTEIASKITMRQRPLYFDLCLLAVQNNASKALKALLQLKTGFDFTSSTAGDVNCIAKLVEAALSSADPKPLLSALIDINRTSSSTKIKNEYFFRNNIPFDFIKSQLTQTPALFSDCVEANLTSAERLKSILDVPSNAENRLSVINNSLVQVAGIGDIEIAKLLLEYQANPNASNALSLQRAAERGQREMVDFLLPHIKTNLCSVLAEQLQQKDSVPQSIIVAIEQRAKGQDASVAPAQQPQAKSGESSPANDDNTLTETTTLPDGATLTTVFNFNSENAVTIYKMGSTVSVAPAVGFNTFKPEYIEAQREILNKRKAAVKAPANKVVLRKTAN
jgi:hypothetical protein